MVFDFDWYIESYVEKKRKEKYYELGKGNK